ncbi:hypothetical protein IE53DRAFT_360080 [Violaceomyces palustris]|uniref:Uncharacterized protein n=1 Tax=Violaceomyces palustris TaxID=1673888 RepID=A0ACD0P5F7_9BASI|nr:hypothetical protein IE53DRAFT_360080 [Violaceomyces palustris]
MARLKLGTMLLLHLSFHLHPMSAAPVLGVPDGGMNPQVDPNPESRPSSSMLRTSTFDRVDLTQGAQRQVHTTPLSGGRMHWSGFRQPSDLQAPTPKKRPREQAVGTSPERGTSQPQVGGEGGNKRLETDLFAQLRARLMDRFKTQYPPHSFEGHGGATYGVQQFGSSSGPSLGSEDPSSAVRAAAGRNPSDLAHLTYPGSNAPVGWSQTGGSSSSLASERQVSRTGENFGPGITAKYPDSSHPGDQPMIQPSNPPVRLDEKGKGRISQLSSQGHTSIPMMSPPPFRIDQYPTHSGRFLSPQSNADAKAKVMLSGKHLGLVTLRNGQTLPVWYSTPFNNVPTGGSGASGSHQAALHRNPVGTSENLTPKEREFKAVAQTLDSLPPSRLSRFGAGAADVTNARILTGTSLTDPGGSKLQNVNHPQTLTQPSSFPHLDPTRTQLFNLEANRAEESGRTIQGSPTASLGSSSEERRTKNLNLGNQEKPFFKALGGVKNLRPPTLHHFF